MFNKEEQIKEEIGRKINKDAQNGDISEIEFREDPEELAKAMEEQECLEAQRHIKSCEKCQRGRYNGFTI